MTAALPPKPYKRPEYPQRPVTKGDLLILGIFIVVLLGVVIGGGAVVWDGINPKEWTANGWSAFGTWFAGGATVAAVWVALRESRRAREAAAAAETDTERRHHEQRWEAAFQYDLAVVGEVQVRLREYTPELFGVEDDLYDFKRLIQQLQRRDRRVLHTRVSDTWLGYVERIEKAQVSAADVAAFIEEARGRTRTPEMEAALATAANQAQVISDLLHPLHIRAQRVHIDKRSVFTQLQLTNRLDLDLIRINVLMDGLTGLHAYASFAETTIRDAIGAARTRPLLSPEDE